MQEFNISLKKLCYNFRQSLSKVQKGPLEDILPTDTLKLRQQLRALVALVITSYGHDHGNATTFSSDREASSIGEQRLKRVASDS